MFQQKMPDIVARFLHPNKAWATGDILARKL
jgi:hypothetical protein